MTKIVPGSHAALLLADLRRLKQQEIPHGSGSTLTVLGSGTGWDNASNARALNEILSETTGSVITGGVPSLRRAINEAATERGLDVFSVPVHVEGSDSSGGSIDAVNTFGVQQALLFLASDKVAAMPGGLALLSEYATAMALHEYGLLPNTPSVVSAAGHQEFSDVLQLFSARFENRKSTDITHVSGDDETIQWDQQFRHHSIDEPMPPLQQFADDCLEVLASTTEADEAIVFLGGQGTTDSVKSLVSRTGDLCLEQHIPIRTIGNCFIPQPHSPSIQANALVQRFETPSSGFSTNAMEGATAIRLHSPLAAREIGLNQVKALVVDIDSWETLSVVLARVVDELTGHSDATAPMVILDPDGSLQPIFTKLRQCMEQFRGSSQGFSKLNFFGPNELQKQTPEQFFRSLAMAHDPGNLNTIELEAAHHLADDLRGTFPDFEQAYLRKLSASFVEALLKHPEHDPLMLLSEGGISGDRIFRWIDAALISLRPWGLAALGNAPMNEINTQLYRNLSQRLPQGSSLLRQVFPEPSFQIDTNQLPQLIAKHAASSDVLISHIERNGAAAFAETDFAKRNLHHASATAEASAAGICQALGTSDIQQLAKIRDICFRMAFTAGSAFEQCFETGLSDEERHLADIKARGAAGTITRKFFDELVHACGLESKNLSALLQSGTVLDDVARHISGLPGSEHLKQDGQLAEVLARALECTWRAGQIHRAKIEGTPHRVSTTVNMGGQKVFTPFAPFDTYRKALYAAEYQRSVRENLNSGQPITETALQEEALKIVKTELRKDYDEFFR